MTYEEAAKKAKEIGGKVAYSQERGFYVMSSLTTTEAPRYLGPEISTQSPVKTTATTQTTSPASSPDTWWPDWTPGFKWPSQTPLGQGFQAPWTNVKPQNPMPEMGGMGGPSYGPYNDPSQIPPELLEKYDWDWFPTGDGTRQIYLIPKGTNEMSPYQSAQIELDRAKFLAGQGDEKTYPLPSGMSAITYDDQGRQYFWNEYSGGYENTGQYNADYDTRVTGEQPSQPMTEYDEEYLDFLRDQLAGQQQWQQQQLQSQEQQRLAQMAAQPISWLQYAAQAGEQPALQPWMLPLMPQQYGQLQAGGAIPGWTGTQNAGQPMTSLPQLTTPSMQYYNRMGPSAQQQYLGYKQARSGSTPEEAEWRLMSMAPPSGYRGLSWAR